MRSVGVLLVHGVGNQSPGETRNAFVQTLRTAVPGVEISESDPPVATARDAAVRLYEVYWADILLLQKNRGTFKEDAPSIAAWFPILNLMRGAYDRKLYSPFLVILWTLALLPIGMVSVLLYFGARFFFQLAQRDRKTPTAAEQLERLKSIGKARERTRERTKLDDILDEFGGDVLNYVNSLAGVLPKDSPLYGCAREIGDRFEAQLAAACRDGCEEIQIVSHSLGTVVTYHGLARHAWDADPLRRITRIYTLGSPLEKIGFFWPRLITRNAAVPPVAGLQWHNICDRLDPVAGRLKRFDHWTPVRNIRVWGLGGAARAHLVYQRSPVFQDLVTEGLFGSPSHGKVSRAWSAFLASLETLLVPIVLAACAIVGLGFVFLAAALIPYLVGWSISAIGFDAIGTAIRERGTWIMFAMFLLALLLGSLSQASDEHRRFL